MSEWRDRDGSVWGAPCENWDFTLEVLENHRRPISCPFRPRHNLLKFHFLYTVGCQSTYQIRVDQVTEPLP